MKPLPNSIVRLADKDLIKLSPYFALLAPFHLDGLPANPLLQIGGRLLPPFLVRFRRVNVEKPNLFLLAALWLHVNRVAVRHPHNLAVLPLYAAMPQEPK